MKQIRLRREGLCVGALVATTIFVDANEAYELVFSSFLGGSDWEHARDIVADDDGYIYVVGGTASRDFPTTEGAFDREFNEGGAQIGDAGPCDAFVAKFGPGGELIWSTLIGGPNYDRAYAVEVDQQGSIYIAGRAGPGFPVSENAFQPRFGGSGYNGFYGEQNGFAAKIAPDGSQLIWSSYVGVGELCRDLAIDSEGSVYLPLGWNTRSSQSPRPQWFDRAFQNAFQTAPQGGNDCGVIKINSEGSEVLWATFLGGSGKETQEASIRVDSQGRVYTTFNTQSNDMPTTEGAFGREHFGGEDGYVALISSDGSRLIYGTYIGGSGTEWVVNTHNLAIDEQGNAYISIVTSSRDFPTTEGVWDRTLDGENEIAIVKLSPTGGLVASTFVGGRKSENPDGIYVDAAGSVFFVGETSSEDFPTSESAFQRTFGGAGDAVVVRLSPSLDRILYSSFMGGPSVDNGRSGYLGRDGSLYLTGATNGPGWPTQNAAQSEFAGGGGQWGNGDCIVARFLKRVSP